MPLKALRIPNLVGGLNLQDSSLLLNNNECTSALGVYFANGKVKRERGVATFGGSFAGRAQLLYDMTKSDGTEYLMLFTTSYVYVYDATTELWDKVSDGFRMALTATTAAASAVLTCTATWEEGIGDAVISDGDEIIVVLDDGTLFSSTIASKVDDTSITLDDVLPSQATSGAIIFRPRKLTHTTTNAVSVSYWEYKEMLYITNNVDPPFQWDGVTCQQWHDESLAYGSRVTTYPDATSFVCKDLIIYKDRLFTINSIENSVRLNQRIRWCVSLDPTVWDSVVNPDAGYVDFYDLPEHLLAIEELNDMLVIYRDFSMLRGQYTGSVTTLISWKTVLTKESALSFNGLFKDKTRHVVIGEEDIFTYSGGYSVDSLSTKIRDYMHTLLSNIQISDVWSAYAFKQPDLEEYWFCITTNANAYVYKYNINTKTWSVAAYEGVLNAVGIYRDTHNITIDDVEDTIDSYEYTFDDAFLARERNRIMFDNNGSLLAYDVTNTTFDTASIAFDLQTKDFIADEFEAKTIRIDHLELELFASTGIEIDYSTNGGNTWTEYRSLVTGTLESMTDVYKQIIVSKVRFRFSGTDASFQLGGINIYYRIEEIE